MLRSTANPTAILKSIPGDWPGNLKFKKETRKEKRENRKEQYQYCKTINTFVVNKIYYFRLFPVLIVFQNAGLIKRLKYTVLVILE